LILINVNRHIQEWIILNYLFSLAVKICHKNRIQKVLLYNKFTFIISNFITNAFFTTIWQESEAKSEKEGKNSQHNIDFKTLILMSLNCNWSLTREMYIIVRCYIYCANIVEFSMLKTLRQWWETDFSRMHETRRARWR